MAELLPPIRQRFLDDNGDPLAGGKLYSYEAGTTTPKATYVDRAGVTENANPIVLDADGWADVWIGSGYYKFVLKDSSDVEIWTKDQVAIANEAALASAFWRDVVYITDADSPFTVTSAHNGKLISIDTTSGNVSITLPQISSVTLPYNVGFKKKVAGNTVTLNRTGTDTIDGATSKVLETANAACQMIADIDKAPDDWSSLDLGTIADGSVTTAKLADLNVTTAKIADSNVTTIKIADLNVTRAKMATGAIAKKTVRSVTTTDSPTTDDDILLLSGASFTTTLPTAVGNSGAEFELIHGGTSLTQVYTLATTSAQTIGGIASGSYVLYTNGETLKIVSDGANWKIKDHKTDTPWTAFTFNWSAVTTPPTLATTHTKYAFYKRENGTDIRLRIGYAQTSNVGAAAGSGIYKIAIPANVTPDTNFVTASTTTNGSYDVGTFSASTVSVHYAKMWTQFYDSGFLWVPGNITGSATAWGSGSTIAIINNGCQWVIDVTFPVTGWQP